MKFARTAEQRQFGAALRDLLGGAGVPAAARAWAAGDHGPGLAVWKALAGVGVTGLAVPAGHGGLGASPVDLVVACEELGRQPVPGPLAESLAAVPVLLAALAAAPTSPAGPPADLLRGLAEGEFLATLACPPQLPYALDADAAGLVLLAGPGAVWRAQPRAGLSSIDPARRLYEVWPAGTLATGPPAVAAVRRAIDHGTLASAALLLGAGRGLLDAATRHAKTREQFGRPIGSFQAVKHALADVLIGLEFAAPLLHAAALALDAGSPTARRDVSAARVACAGAALRAARTALQVHGAIGYTRESDVGLWLTKVRALSSAWGTQAEHRAVVLTALGQDGTGPWD